MSMPSSICFCTMSFTAPRQPRGARGLVDRLALLLGGEHVQQIGRARQRAGVGGEDALGAVLHDDSPLVSIVAGAGVARF